MKIEIVYNAELYELSYNDGFIWSSGLPDSDYVKLFTDKVFKIFSEAGLNFYTEIGTHWHYGVRNGFSLKVCEK